MIRFLLIIGFCGTIFSGAAQQDSSRLSLLPNSISTDPLLPLFNSAVLLYGRQISLKSEFFVGFWYSKAWETYPKLINYPGSVSSYSGLLSYRYYFWKGLHAEYQIYPGCTHFVDTTLNTKTGSFNLFNEFRVGYQIPFKLFQQHFFVNIQWPVGFNLYNSNKPAAFRAVDEQDPFFYIFYPNIYLGYRF